MNDLTITNKIQHLTNRPPFMLGIDLADIYQTTTRCIAQQVRRNPRRFPEEFCFRLTPVEVENLRSQNVIAISSMDRSEPLAFTDLVAQVVPSTRDAQPQGGSQ
jgi:ORF6N domain